MPEPLTYATPLPANNVHDLGYTVLLGVLAFFMLIAMCTMVFVMRLPGMNPEQVTVFELVLEIELAYGLWKADKTSVPARRS